MIESNEIRYSINLLVFFRVSSTRQTQLIPLFWLLFLSRILAFKSQVHLSCFWNSHKGDRRKPPTLTQTQLPFFIIIIYNGNNYYCH